MRPAKALALALGILALAQCSCQASGQSSAPKSAPLTILTTPQGGIIEYGRIDGATSLAAAMGRVLTEVHQACGEKPSVGQVFRVKGTDTAGVFFTIVNHAQRNRPMAGMVIAAQTGSSQFEAGLVADSSDRFGQTANPMLQQLFGAWNPGGTQPAAATGGGRPGPAPATASATASASASPVPLHRVSAPDNSASLSVPDGWAAQPIGGWGAVVVKGPNGEQIGVGMNKGAVDPTNPWQARMAAARYQVINPGSMVYPFRGDVEKEFVNLFQAWRKAGGVGPARFQVESTKPMPSAQGNHCTQVSGQMDPDGKGMQFFMSLMCASDPTRDYGSYSVMLSHTLIPLAWKDKDAAVVGAILQTYVPNMQVINQESAAMLAKKKQSDQQTLAWAQAQVNQIKQIGAQATARMNATEAANDAQHAGYWAQQNTNARNSAGFSNYLLDQSVVQNNSVGGTGAAGHATVWNSTASALVKANPNKYKIVATPNYWKGIDY